MKKMIDIKFSSSMYYIFICIYKFVLDLSYILCVSEAYAYRQLYLDINIIKYVASWGITLFILFLLPKGQEKVSYMVLQFHYLLMIIPFLSIWGLHDEPILFTFYLVLCFLLEVFLLKIDVKKIDFKCKEISNFFGIKRSKYLIRGILVGLTIYTYIFLLIDNGIHFSAIDFEGIYKIRENTRYSFDFLRYSTIWQYRCINPYFFILGVKRKNYNLMFFAGFLQVLMYFIVARKEVLFSIVLILGIVFLCEKKSFFTVLTNVLGLGCFLTSLSYKLFGFLRGIALLPTRVLFDPAIIKYQFYYVFSNELPKLFYSETKLGRIFGFSYPYEESSGYVVNSFFSSIRAEANTGYLAYGYANMGLIGMILITLLFIFVMYFIDSLVEDKVFAFAFLAYTIMSLNDGDLFLCLLSGGLLLIILIFIMDRELFEGKIS